MQEVDRRGVVDTARIAVGGHSYGAFMAANLLVRLCDVLGVIFSLCSFRGVNMLMAAQETAQAMQGISIQYTQSCIVVLLDWSFATVFWPI